jgi:hypothetical protein
VSHQTGIQQDKVQAFEASHSAITSILRVIHVGKAACVSLSAKVV